MIKMDLGLVIPCMLKYCELLKMMAPTLEIVAGICIYPDAVWVTSRLYEQQRRNQKRKERYKKNAEEARFKGVDEL